MKQLAANMISKISGKRSCAEIKHLQVGEKEVTTVTEIADTLAAVSYTHLTLPTNREV